MLTSENQNTSLGKLPYDWKVTFLKSVTEKTEKRDPRKEPNQSFRYIDVSSVSNEAYKIIGWKELVGKEAPSRARKVVRSKDTIFATVRPYLKNIAQIPEYLDDEICSTGFCVIRANHQLLDPDYLFFLALSDSFIESIVSQQRGSSYPAVSDKVVLETTILLPPLTEQRAIANVLSSVRRAIDATEQVIDAAKELKRSMMKHLFTYGPVPVDQADQVVLKETEIGEVPEEWEVTSLEEKTEIFMGQSPPGSTYNENGDGIPLINGPAEYGEIHPKPVKWTTHPTRLCLPNDILICVRGNTTGRLNISDREYCIGRGVAAIRGIEHKSTTEFLHQYLSFIENHILDFSASGGSTFPNITKSQIINWQTPFPPISSQEVITKLLKIVDNKIRVEIRRKSAFEALFNSLLHHLMTGKVRVPYEEGGEI